MDEAFFVRMLELIGQVLDVGKRAGLGHALLCILNGVKLKTRLQVDVKVSLTLNLQLALAVHYFFNLF